MKSSISSMKRWNPLLGEWTIFAPLTDKRPWNGVVISARKNELPELDPGCYLCPGALRANGKKNPDYEDIYVFNNDFPSLTMNKDTESATTMYDNQALGDCRVLCFSPKHNITLAEMEANDVEKVLHAFCRQFRELSSIPEVEYVMIFENKGEVIGVSNPHPHGQIYATDFIPRIPLAMYTSAIEFQGKKGKCLFCDLLEKELESKIRIVCQNEHFAAYVPYFARLKYEVIIMCRRHIPSMDFLTRNEMTSLANIYHEIVIRYDNLFQMPFPNNTVLYNVPCKEDLDSSPWHFHIAFYPPMRSADKLKYMAGFETGGGNIVNPSLPRDSAKELREVPDVHYLRNARPGRIN